MLEAYFTECLRLILLGDEWRHYQELATDLTILTDTSVIFKRWMSESVNSGLLCNTTLPPPPPSIGVGQGQLSFFFFSKFKHINKMKYNANFNSKWSSNLQSGVSFSRLHYRNNFRIWSVKYGSWVAVINWPWMTIAVCL